MDAPRFAQLKDLVAAALEMPAAARDAFVRERCPADPELQREALELLVLQHDTTAGAVTVDVAARIRSAAAQVVAGAAHPERIGVYRIVDVLGEGGMGTVYRAFQEQPLQREVALKVIRRGTGGAAVATRFAAESQALAVMDHPHIARIFDVGTTDGGQPWFAMELVAGRSLTKYCDEQRLPLDQRLDLFEKICHAVQHAHQRGIIHRDLKPSNILVAEVDGVPMPRIIDFGIAKVTSDGLDPGLLLTEAGVLMGTLEYMSPEQALGEPARVDTRADIYSLGVMLYELVCGRLPLESESLRRAASLEALRILRDVDPPRPSLRLASSDPETATNAKARSTDLRSLRRQVRGDLDWVVMKALEKDPDRRYQAAHELALDIARSRRHEPVQAGPPSARYRAQKFARRHRAGVVTATTVLMAIVAGAGLAVTGMVRATHAQRRAETEVATTRSINGFLTDMLVAVQPDKARGKDVMVRDILDVAAARLDEGDRFAGKPEVEASLSFTIGDTYLELGDYESAMKFLERALVIRRRVLDPDDERIVETLGRIGRIHWEKGDLESSLKSAQEVLAIRERTVGRLHPEYAAVLGNLGNTYADLGRTDEAERYLREALAIDRQVLTDEQGGDLAISINNLATLLSDQGKFAEAVLLHEESLSLRRRFYGEPSGAVVRALDNLGFAQTGLGDYATAEATLRKAVGEATGIYGADHPQTALVMRNLAAALQKQGKLGEAETLLRRAESVFTTTAGEMSWRVGAVRSSLGALLTELGRRDEAEKELLAGWEILSATLDKESKTVRGAAASLAALYRLRGDEAQAAAWQGRAE